MSRKHWQDSLRLYRIFLRSGRRSFIVYRLIGTLIYCRHGLMRRSAHQCRHVVHRALVRCTTDFIFQFILDSRAVAIDIVVQTHFRHL